MEWVKYTGWNRTSSRPVAGYADRCMADTDPQLIRMDGQTSDSLQRSAWRLSSVPTFQASLQLASWTSVKNGRRSPSSAPAAGHPNPSDATSGAGWPTGALGHVRGPQICDPRAPRGRWARDGSSVGLWEVGGHCSSLARIITEATDWCQV